jgi:predicted ATPase
MLIKDVEVKGFWGRTAAASFFADVTIFIGLNGTGKTTFINLISAVLTVDLFQLSSLQFEEITINLIESNKKSKRKITVVSSQESSSTFNAYSIYEYKVGTKTYTVSLTPDARLRKPLSEKESFRYLSPDARREYMSLKREISGLVEISQISVYRQVTSESFEGDPRQRATGACHLFYKQLYLADGHW